MIDFAIGILIAIGSAAAFGSFGVPIKCRRILEAQVDPLAYQFYKSLVCFSTSWLVLTYNQFRFTWWGTVGAAIWVANGVMAIMAIQKAGLGITQTTWSALSIFVSFIWGAFVFHEPIRSLSLAFVGLVLMALGMGGLGFAAQQVASGVVEVDASGEALRLAEDAGDVPKIGKGTTVPRFHLVPDADSREPECPATCPEEDAPDISEKALLEAKRRNFCIGVFLACCIGVTNGSFLVPLKYAQKEITGIIYLLSFGIGAALVTVVAGIMYAIACKLLGRPVPSLQVRVASGPAVLTGVLWSLGNFLSIYAVEYLGLSLGWPLVQCQLIVSSLWAILYYHEISGWRTVATFAVSTICILIGVFVLASYGV